MLNRHAASWVLFLSASWLILSTPDGFAQSSLGLGNSEQAIRPEGIFAGLLLWIQQQQQEFYQAMTNALKGIREDKTQFWLLVGLSFLYGIFHAAGPGHGKAVISSYMLANEVTVKRGVLLSFASAIMQGLTAIVVIGSILLLLRGSGIKSSELARFLEVTSYFFVMVLGVYLIWTKALRKKTAHAHQHVHDHAHDHQHDHHQHDHHQHDHHHHDQIQIEDSHVCDSCGHAHMPDPKTLEGKFGGREAFSAILAVGLRPCTGAIIVLTFAFLNGLYAAGIFSTLAMSIGTAITVASMAILAVTAKNTALRIAGWQDKAEIIHRVIEIAGAALVFLLGFLLFTAAISF